MENGIKHHILISLDAKGDKLIYENSDIEFPNSKGLADAIKIKQNSIEIDCYRKKAYDLEDLITNDNNSIIDLIKKTLIYMGLKSKVIPKISKINLERHDSVGKIEKEYSISKKEINTFLTTDKKIKLDCPEHIEKIFRIKSKTNKIDYKPYYIASSRYLFSKLQDNEHYLEFIQLWSAYNSLYNIFAPGDAAGMKRMKEYINNNADNFKASINFCKKIRDNITLFPWKPFFIRNYKRNAQQKINYKGYDTSSIDKEKLILELYKNNFLKYLEKYGKHETPVTTKSSSHFIELQKFIDSNEDKVKENNILFLSFFVNQYVYSVRNNYFHGNEEGLQFSIVNYNEHKQLKILIELMNLLIVDLLNSYEDLFAVKNLKNNNKQNVT